MADKAADKERREHIRITEPAIGMMIGKKTYTSINWSLGGALIDDYKGELTPGSLFTISELGSAKGKLTKVSVQARVIRLDEKPKILAINFLEIDNQAYAILQTMLAKKMEAMKNAAETN
ncbi:MAG: PilZ domain-containing protein [Rhodospirillaceae bacterium]|nr:PilZ domain-containing protein [Rhodospirillaceae bacterium]